MELAVAEEAMFLAESLKPSAKFEVIRWAIAGLVLKGAGAPFADELFAQRQRPKCKARREGA